MRRVPLVCAVVIVLAPLALDGGGARVRVRFRVDGAPGLAAAVHARPVFGDAADVRAHAVAGAPELSRWFFIEAPAADVDGAVADLARRGARDVSVEPRAEPASVARDDGPSCPVKTPAYDARQGYRAALRIDAAWALPGGRGKGVSLADVEGEWNTAHEDLPGERIRHVAGRRQRSAGWRAHGTAVLGVLAAKDNGQGMLGLVPDVDRVVTSSLGGIGPARAIYEAAKALAPGDVLVVELHGPGPNADGRGQNGFVPMEWWQPEFDAIRWATHKGVVVVEAGGNGGEDLDAPVYRSRFDRRERDSGAILVGAGAPEGANQRERTRLSFSNYGARVDVQGWGALVATLDYGDLQGCSAPARKYTARFAGTSSASPVVAGAAAALEGAWKAAHGGQPLSPLALRALLSSTGTPQPIDDARRTPIGPMPDVARALATLGL